MPYAAVGPDNSGSPSSAAGAQPKGYSAARSQRQIIFDAKAARNGLLGRGGAMRDEPCLPGRLQRTIWIPSIAAITQSPRSGVRCVVCMIPVSVPTKCKIQQICTRHAANE